MFLFWSLVISVILQLIIIYSPLNSLFGIVPIPLVSWVILVSGVLLGYFLATLIVNLINKKIRV